MLRVSGMIWRHHRSHARPWYEAPAVVRLLVVVLVAEPVELVEPGVFRLRELNARGVVGFEARSTAASLDRARRLLPQQRDLLRCGRSTAEAGDVADIDAVRKDELEHRVAEQPPRDLDGHRTDAGDLADLARRRPPVDECTQVSSDHRGVSRRCLAPAAPRARRAISTIASARYASRRSLPPAPTRCGEQLVDDGVQGDVDLGEVLSRGLDVQVMEPVGGAVPATAPALA